MRYVIIFVIHSGRFALRNSEEFRKSKKNNVYLKNIEYEQEDKFYFFYIGYLIHTDIAYFIVV